MFGFKKAVKQFEKIGTGEYRIEMLREGEARKWYNTTNVDKAKKIPKIVQSTVKGRPIDILRVYKNSDSGFQVIYEGSPQEYLNNPVF
jgi:hypothetical protein